MLSQTLSLKQILSLSCLSLFQKTTNDLRLCSVRMRSLQSLQNEIRKELESNETTLSEQIRANKEHLDSHAVQMLVNAIQDCVARYERIQVELQKLYRDQIFEEKALLDHYRKLRPNELDLHNQIKLAIDRWQLIYNQLLDMQLREKERNTERKAEYGRLLNDLELKNQRKSTQHSSSSSASSIHHLADLNYPYSNQPQHQQHTIHSSHSPHLDAKTSSLSSSEFVSSSYSSSSSSSSSHGEPDKASYSTYSSSKSSGSHQPTNYFYSSSSSTGKVGGAPMAIGKTQLPIQLEENSLIFRRPDSLKNVTCLHKWFEDLGREDADWMKRQQIKNENWFEELVRLQKAQWDKLHEEHNQRKEQHLPQTFKCELESKTLCDQEEENFKKMWSQYRAEQYPPSKLGNQQQSLNQQNYNQQNYNQQNYYQPTYGQQQQQRQQPIIYSSGSQKSQQSISYSTST